jgi:hypothetical protein
MEAFQHYLKKHNLALTLDGVVKNENIVADILSLDDCVPLIETTAVDLILAFKPTSRVSKFSVELMRDEYDNILNNIDDNKWLNDKEHIPIGVFISAMVIRGINWKIDNTTIKFKCIKTDIFRTCIDCNSTHHKNAFPNCGKSTSKRCKKCTTNHIRTHPNGFKDIPPETVININKYICDGFALKQIAAKFNIPYANLWYWKKHGIFVVKK